MKITIAAFSLCLALSLATGAEIEKNEKIVFFPTYAFESGSGTVTVNIHGWIFNPKEASVKRKYLVSLMGEAVDIEEDEPGYQLFTERAKRFLVDNKGGRNIRIQISGRIINLPESDDNGHIEKKLAVEKAEARSLFKKNVLKYSVLTGNHDPESFTGEILYVPRKGISVISDIDDTIKISNVLNRKELIRNTFTRDFVPVPGMANLYRRWAEKGLSFHYVSGSPWQLFEPMDQFLSNAKFPRGSMHLKYFRLKDSSGLDFLSADQREYKIKVISGIIEDFPHRQFILVGDSGENDPEVYAAIAKKYGKRIRAICIRDVKNPGDAKDRFTVISDNLKDTPFILFNNAPEISSLLHIN